MATRMRQQSAAPSTATARSSNSALPPYEPPSFSLTPAAQRQLATLTQMHSVKKLNEHLAEAQAAVSTAAADINDRLTNGERYHKKRKERAAEDGAENPDSQDDERSLEELRDKVDRMTQRMEESMRKLIDGQHSVQSITDSISSTAEHARVNASTQASMQARTQTQRRRTGTEGEDDEDDEYQDFEPTDPAAGTQAQASMIDKFRKDLDTAKTRYQSHSMEARYANNNSYRDFRRVVHDARHPDDDEPLPPHEDWFPEGERPAPGVTTRRARAEAEADDSDDDIAVSKASISTKCPLTLQEFKNPLTSTKCPHSFESEAILQMLSQARPQPVNPNGRPEKAVECPVSGCSKMLTKGDLQKDNVLIRKIRRLQEAARLEEEDEEDEEDGRGRGATQRGAMVVDDEDEDGADVDAIVEGKVKGTQVKGEPGGARASQRPSQRAGAGVVDLAGSSEDEAEEGEEMEE